MNARVLWHWWVGQLAEWIPDGLRQRLGGRRDVLVVDLGRDGPDAHAVVGGKRHALGHSGPGTTDCWRATLLAALDSLPSRPSTLQIRIPPGSCLRRDLDLPFAAEGNLRDAGELQERLKSIALGHAGRILSARVLQATAVGPFERVIVDARLEISLEGLQDLLHEIESRKPYLFVDEFSVMSRPQRRGSPAGAATNLETRLTLDGLRRRGDALGERRG